VQGCAAWARVSEGAEGLQHGMLVVALACSSHRASGKKYCSGCAAAAAAAAIAAAAAAAAIVCAVLVAVVKRCQAATHAQNSV
jgi:hypothetical protein